MCGIFRLFCLKTTKFLNFVILSKIATLEYVLIYIFKEKKLKFYKHTLYKLLTLA